MDLKTLVNNRSEFLVKHSGKKSHRKVLERLLSFGIKWHGTDTNLDEICVLYPHYRWRIIRVKPSCLYMSGAGYYMEGAESCINSGEFLRITRPAKQAVTSPPVEG